MIYDAVLGQETLSKPQSDLLGNIIELFRILDLYY